MSNVEYLLRVHAEHDGTWIATLRQFAATSHPEVRAMVGPVAHGVGANGPAAVVAAVAAAHIETVSVPRESRYAC